MAPFVVLVLVGGIARLIGLLPHAGWLDSWPHAVRLGLAAMFILTASAHFLRPRREALIVMVPERLPGPAALVTVTGILEFASAAGLLIPPVAPIAAICLALMLIAMFPANVRAARSGVGLKTVPLPARTALQVIFIAACVLAAC
ncbi:DoxX family protein [Nocardia macrotermitis]|uniref:DoxX family protein n=1 Tax=Nocardia macrotermitis TaxID=2585198 RepID=A0A7K0CXT3_9NOCA|nr:DoxX family protein [Nocardia macrotermitis]MQY17454.1 hypothetical protein [Nocardia macrotermitis]